MAITENKFDVNEFQTAIDANPDLLPIVKQALTGKKFVVHDETEHNTFKQNYEATIAANLTKTHAEKLEADVLEATGIKKNPDEKYYDYFKRATNEKLSQVKNLEAELDKLKKNPNPSAADKARIEQLEAGIQEKEAALEKLKEEKDGEIHNLKVGSKIDSAIAAMRSKYKGELPASVLAIMEQKVKDDLLKIAKVQADGTVTFLNEKGEPIVDSAFKPKGPEALVAEMMKDVIDEGKQQGGTGSGEGSQGSGGSGGNKEKPAPITGIPAEVKTRVQLSEYLLKSGLAHGTKEFDEAFSNFGKDLPTR